MSHTSWDGTPMGSAPPYHQDPSPGGAPVLSPDGHWRWAVDHWELCDDPAESSEEDPAPGQDAVDSLD